MDAANACQGKPTKVILPEYMARHCFGGALANDKRCYEENNAHYVVLQYPDCEGFRQPYLVDGFAGPLFHKRMFLVATKDIAASQEVLVPYGHNYWAKLAVQHEAHSYCTCGPGASCRTKL